MEESSPKSVVDLITKFVHDCFWILLQVITRPASFGEDTAPTSEETVLFVATAAFAVAALARLTKASVPAIILWNTTQSTILIATLREWSDLQAGDKSLSVIATWAAFSTILLTIAALSMTLSLMLIQHRRFHRIEFGETLRRSFILVSTAVMIIVVSEAFFPIVARSRVPGWIVGTLGVIFITVVPTYTFLVIPYLVWRRAFRRSRLSIALSVLISWPLALLLAEPVRFDYFAPETRIDSVLSAQLQSIIHLIALEDYRQAGDQATQAATSDDDSIQLDAVTLTIRRRALARALNLDKAPDKDHATDSVDWSSDSKSRYNDLVELTNRLQHKYSDVPGMLLAVGRAQLESGQCDKAQVIFEAVYGHRHAALMEQVMAGLYLHTMNHPPADFGPLLARFGPSDDRTFMRAFLASPGIALGMYGVNLGEFGNRIVELRAYANQLLVGPSPQQCALATQH